jgi:hypothetical protein
VGSGEEQEEEGEMMWSNSQTADYTWIQFADRDGGVIYIKVGCIVSFTDSTVETDTKEYSNLNDVIKTMSDFIDKENARMNRRG